MSYRGKPVVAHEAGVSAPNSIILGTRPTPKPMAKQIPHQSIERDGVAPEAAVEWLAEHGDALWRYAMVRVRRADLVEEMVQETFAAALGASADFRGESSVRTWLISILKRRIADHARRERRDERTSHVWTKSFTELYDDRGMWSSGVGGAARLTEGEREEFARDLERCVAKLPGKTAETFMLREVRHLSAEVICDRLQMSRENYWVRMHRARMLLRNCLSGRWWPGTRAGTAAAGEAAC